MMHDVMYDMMCDMMYDMMRCGGCFYLVLLAESIGAVLHEAVQSRLTCLQAINQLDSHLEAHEEEVQVMPSKKSTLSNSMTKFLITDDNCTYLSINQSIVYLPTYISIIPIIYLSSTLPPHLSHVYDTQETWNHIRCQSLNQGHFKKQEDDIIQQRVRELENKTNATGRLPLGVWTSIGNELNRNAKSVSQRYTLICASGSGTDSG